MLVPFLFGTHNLRLLKFLGSAVCAPPGGTTHGTPTDVCGKKTPPEKKTIGKISLQSTKSGAGEQLLPLDCKARAHLEGMFVSWTPVVTHDNKHINDETNMVTVTHIIAMLIAILTTMMSMSVNIIIMLIMLIMLIVTMIKQIIIIMITHIIRATKRCYRLSWCLFTDTGVPPVKLRWLISCTGYTITSTTYISTTH